MPKYWKEIDGGTARRCWVVELRKGDLDKTRFDRDDLELEGLLALPLEAHHVRIGTLGYTARIKIRGLGKRRTPSRAAKRRE